MDKNRATFEASIRRYRRARARLAAKAGERHRETAVESVDQALDELMDVPSPSLGAFGEKVRILESEYGLDAQPRHIRAIYLDVAILVALCADALHQTLPMS